MIDKITNELIDNLNKLEESFKQDLSTFRIGKAHPDMLNNININCYGSKNMLNKVAVITASRDNMLVITPWDKGILKLIDKAVREFNLDFNPILDGDKIRIIIPKPTEDGRKRMVKTIRSMGESYKIIIRNHRHDTLEKLSDNKFFGKDEIYRAKKKTDEISNNFMKKLDEIRFTKEKDILNF